ncbi:DUF2889 domain-containing protein [Nitrogeniibacter aestuarii]|uniref:DUF2889 domain-containing protein n=1 Tax=Nitrogeniibacter aestuarii TaxID=2815343 RepID=UPI001E35966D|nr:DUF2889 domain-containing protein [Nitrogeniibacter aestuarii]
MFGAKDAWHASIVQQQRTKTLKLMSKLVAHAPESGRRLIHSRRIQLDGYLRSDGLLEIEARLSDTKAVDYAISSGIRKAGEPIHEMVILVVVDARMDVVSVAAKSQAVPYPGACEEIAPAYASLAGLNLMAGFREAVRSQLGGIQGCSHLTELLLAVPTAAVQTFASFFRDNEDAAQKPFQLDRCHALDSRGETVRNYYAKWYVAD